ncbi:cytochrome P450 [Labrenzia sp. PHM005]|uniref:cytochrome P450 n=1 Tax=Labrenzia sp. PHM005 TaxID=2590016 RepID=UPI00143D0311|nr:cytochrome P450 [Labrenzia sp. PHM005]
MSVPEETDTDWWTMLADPDFLADPHDRLDVLRAENPIHFDPASGCYFILGHAEFSEAMRNKAIGRDSRNWKGGWHSDPGFRERDPVAFRLFSLFQPQMINVDGIDHARMRGVYEPAFRAQAVAQLEGMVREETERLIAALPSDGRPVNLIDAYAQPMPLNVLCRLFDIPRDMADTVSDWSKKLIQIGDLMLTDQQKSDGLEALTAFKSYLREQLSVSSTGTEGSLMRLALQGLDNGTLDEEETLTNLVALLIAGHETTVTLIGIGLKLLLEHPKEMERLRAQPDLARNAADETLRYDPGGNFLLRVAAQSCEIGGVKIPQGAPVIGLLRATNRDPARFKDPHRFDITRTGNAHHTFGGGAHFCLGAPLARMEGRLAFQCLLSAFADIELQEPPRWLNMGTNARSLESLIVTLKR